MYMPIDTLQACLGQRKKGRDDRHVTKAQRPPFAREEHDNTNTTAEQLKPNS